MAFTEIPSSRTEESRARTLALEAARLAAAEPERAEELGRQAEDLAVKDHDWATTSMARRARGVAALHLRRLDDAVATLRRAIAAAERAGDPALGGEAQTSLASALVLRGQPELGFVAIDAALRSLSGLPAARARTQRAAMLQELGRVDEALDDLRAALPVLRRAHDVQWENRALSNRSLLLIAHRQFAAAEGDLLRARALCAEHGLTVSGAYVEQNLGCLFAARGDVPRALSHFDAAGKLYAAHGMQVGSLLVDRAKVLMSVRLVAEARTAAEAAVRIFDAQHRKVHLPEALLMVSTTALLGGDRVAALTVARSAAQAFGRLGRGEWQTLARYAQLQARLGGLAADEAEDSDGAEPAPRITPAHVRRMADDLEQAGWVVPSLEARIVAGRLATARGRRSEARRDFARAASARRLGPAEVRARAWLGEALLREEEGSRRGAKSALRAGLRIVEEYRATLGATELRAHVSVHRGAIARTGLRMALEDGDPAAVHWWGERGRASADAPRPVQPPAEPELAHDLEDLRTTMSEIEEMRGTGGSTTALVSRQVRLERLIRNRTLTLDSGQAPAFSTPPSLTELSNQLGDAALVEFVGLGHTVHALTLVNGRAHLHALGPDQAVRHCAEHLPFAFHRLAGPATRPLQLQAAQQVWDRAAVTLSAVLLEPMAALLGDRPLVIVPVGWLQSLPWSILRMCAGRPVTVAPSAALWSAANRRQPSSERVVAVAGPGLAEAAAEARDIADLYPGATVLAGGEATAAASSAALDGARLVHVAAHGQLRADNPLFSSLRLSDGPFTVYDIEQLARSPHHVSLAACSTAVSHITAGQEILGLAAALLTQQTASLVAPVVPIPDAETRPVMATYHRHLRKSLPPAAALAATQVDFADGTPRERASAASFICLGAGCSSPIAPVVRRQPDGAASGSS